MKQTYTVKEPLRHDGAAYAPGDTVEMDNRRAGELVAIGVLEEQAVEVSMSQSRPNGQVVIAAVKAAATIEELNTLAEGEDRKGVLAVIEARRKELEA